MLRTYNKKRFLLKIRSVSVSTDIIYFTDYERRKIISMCIPVLNNVVSVFLKKTIFLSFFNFVCVYVCVHCKYMYGVG
jgi:hypothetical protein